MSQDLLLLPTQERQLRQDLSGFKIDLLTQERARLYVEGQLSLKEFWRIEVHGRFSRHRRENQRTLGSSR
jgi:hypothetical protein